MAVNYDIRARVGLEDRFSRPARGVNSSSAAMAKGFVGAATAAYGVKKAIDFSVDASKKFADFQYGMSAVQAVTQATTEEMEKLKNSALDLASGTKFRPEEVAESMKFLGLAGFEANEILAATPGLLNLATASGGDLATTTDILSDNLTALGLKISDTDRLTDIFARTATSSNTSVLQLGEAMSYAAADAKGFGLSAEQTAAALGIMADNGIKASRGGTALRGILTRLIKPSKEAAARMKELGINIAQDGKIKDFNTIIGETQVALSKLNQEDRKRTVSLLFGQVASAGANALLDTSIEKYNDFVTSLENSNGAAKQMAVTMEDNLKGSVTKLDSAVDVFKVKFGEAFGEESKEAVDLLADIISENSDEMASSLGAVAASFVDLSVAITENSIMTSRKANAMFEEIGEGAENLKNRLLGIDEALDPIREALGFKGSRDFKITGTSKYEEQFFKEKESKRIEDILKFGVRRRKEELIGSYGSGSQALQGLSQELGVSTPTLSKTFPKAYDVSGVRKSAISTQVNKLMDISIQSLSIQGGDIKSIVNDPKVIYQVGEQVMGELVKQLENSKNSPLIVD